ncbi:hypothetical protein LCGC14_1342070 [marine sediment metagenome]|uniref:Uncharacterized protein n=1 Tax=marine sediment metagenome TaxID=412755 RepID=A0A0F9KD83_9ZZZZ
MKKITYIITIPEVLTKLAGAQNIRGALELAAQIIFKDWAHPNLVEKIQVTKPRERNGEGNG